MVLAPQRRKVWSNLVPDLFQMLRLRQSPYEFFAAKRRILFGEKKKRRISTH